MDRAMSVSPATVTPRHYKVACLSCGREQNDDGWLLSCCEGDSAALLRSVYNSRKFVPQIWRNDLFRYQEWLPIIRVHEYAGLSVTYRSTGLARALGMPNLWISFNGYWPEKGAFLETGSFKELEAYTVLGRIPDQQVTLTVPTSGNTGAAFAWACTRTAQPCVLVIPQLGLHRMQFRDSLSKSVRLVVVDNGDYGDAMELAASISRMPGFHAEGGIKNIGRRDGLATVLFSAYEKMECLPTYYFQAVGSGTGAVAVLEAARRICSTGSAGKVPKLMLCQNLPFTPIHDAWKMKRNYLRERSIPPRSANEPYAITESYADELRNPKPPYAVKGGVHDALIESEGDVLVTDNISVKDAMKMFHDLEGVDIEPAAGVAAACLREAVTGQRIERDATVLLNVTGGGRLRLQKEHRLVQAQPHIRVGKNDIASKSTLRELAELFN